MSDIHYAHISLSTSCLFNWRLHSHNYSDYFHYFIWFIWWWKSTQFPNNSIVAECINAIRNEYNFMEIQYFNQNREIFFGTISFYWHTVTLMLNFSIGMFDGLCFVFFFLIWMLELVHLFIKWVEILNNFNTILIFLMVTQSIVVCLFVYVSSFFCGSCNSMLNSNNDTALSWIIFFHFEIIYDYSNMNMFCS